MAGSEHQAANAAASKTRIQGVTGQQTVKNSAGLLQRVIVANAAAAVGTLTLFDGGTTLLVLQVPANTTIVLAVWAQFVTSILATPSAATIDALFLYD